MLTNFLHKIKYFFKLHLSKKLFLQQRRKHRIGFVFPAFQQFGMQELKPEFLHYKMYHIFIFGGKNRTGDVQEITFILQACNGIAYNFLLQLMIGFDLAFLKKTELLRRAAPGTGTRAGYIANNQLETVVESCFISRKIRDNCPVLTNTSLGKTFLQVM